MANNHYPNGHPPPQYYDSHSYAQPPPGGPNQQGYGGYQNYPPPQQGYPPPQPYPPQQQYAGGMSYQQMGDDGHPYGPPPQAYPPQQPPYDPNNPPKPQRASDELAGKKNERFVPTGAWQDVWALILFYLHLAGFIALAVLFLPYLKFEDASQQQSGQSRNLTTDVKRHAIALAIGAVISLLGTVGYLGLLRAHTLVIVKGSFFASIVLFVALAIFQFVSKSYIAGVVLLVMALYFVFMYRAFRQRMGLVACMIQTVLDVANKYKGTFATSLTSLFLSFGHSILALLVILGAYQGYYNPAQQTVEGAFYGVLVFAMFSLYWTQETIKNTVHVTLAGVFASFYFLSPPIRGGGSASNAGNTQAPGMPANPTLQALKRATTTSFGSVAFGSLLVALLRLIRALIRQMMQQSDDGVMAFLAIILDCILGCIEGIIEFFNEYAFAQVAIYGKPYCRAAKDTMNLFKLRGLDMVITENLTGSVTFVGALLIGGIGALVTFLAGLALGINFFSTTGDEVVWAIVLLVAALIVGVLMFSIAATVIDSGVTTTFVCLAEEPEALWRTKPELFDRVKETWPDIQLPINTV